MPVLVVLLAYLLGSLSAGIVYSRLQGQDVRDRDLPGGSGMFRQYGPRVGVLVIVLDVLKGVVAGLLARWLAPEYSWLAVGAVVLGHCYPVYFGFNGGGGIAPFAGAMLAVAPITTLLTLLVAAVLAPLYKFTVQRLLRLNVVPVVAALSLLAGLLLGWRFGGLYDLLAGGLVMLLRAVQLLMARPAATA